MELLHVNLTHFLEQSQEPLPFHIQISLCPDIVLAFTFKRYQWQIQVGSMGSMESPFYKKALLIM